MFKEINLKKQTLKNNVECENIFKHLYKLKEKNGKMSIIKFAVNFESSLTTLKFYSFSHEKRKFKVFSSYKSIFYSKNFIKHKHCFKLQCFYYLAKKCHE